MNKCSLSNFSFKQFQCSLQIKNVANFHNEKYPDHMLAFLIIKRILSWNISLSNVLYIYVSTKE